MLGTTPNAERNGVNYSEAPVQVCTVTVCHVLRSFLCLQALKSLLPDKELPAVQAALPSWAYTFPRLLLDSNRSVRAEASNLMGVFATLLGRRLAPSLRTVLGPW